jgi:hypothetical protein
MAASPDKVVHTDSKTGSGFAMPIKLFGEPLKLETATVLPKS